MLPELVGASLVCFGRQDSSIYCKGLECFPRVQPGAVSAEGRSTGMKGSEMRGTTSAFRPFIEKFVSLKNVTDLAREAEANEDGNGLGEADIFHAELP